MKFAIKCLLIIFVSSLSSCNNLDTNLAHNKKLDIIEKPFVSPTIEQNNKILNKNYDIAEQALSKAILEKDKNTIRLGLGSPILTIRQKTVAAIAEFNDKTFIPDLIEALSDNQIMLEGGTETKFIQKKLNETIVSALKDLTGLEFSNTEKLTNEDIEKILKESREWWETNKGIL